MEHTIKHIDPLTVVHIACDHNNDERPYVEGTFLGYTEVPARDGWGTLRPTAFAIVQFDHNASGYLNRDGYLPSSYIEYTLVEPHLVSVAPWYVGVYEVYRCYGGPEEGGWWYDSGSLILAEMYDTYDEALQRGSELEVEWPDNNTYTSVVYSGGDYRVRIDTEPPRNYPEDRPRYE